MGITKINQHFTYYLYWSTTLLNSFTDGLIPSVTGMKSVGEIITDGLTDGTRPSVTPIFVAKSVADKKKYPPTILQKDTRAPKKTFPAGTLPTE